MRKMMSGNKIEEHLIRKMIEAGIDSDDVRLEVSLFAEEACDDDELKAFAERRIQGEPMAYILGYRDFYRDRFSVAPGVLIPRSDTEILVECALKFAGVLDFPMGDVLNIPECSYKPDKIRFADLCTGTGCIGISVYKELIRHGRDAEAILTDISPDALSCSSMNIERLTGEHDKIRVIKNDVLEDVNMTDIFDPETADIIISNPPYINDNDMKELDDVVGHHEPHLALEGGADGLRFYPPVAHRAMSLLKAGGALMVEHGYDQGEAVRKIFSHAGFKNVMTLRDYGSVERVTFGIK